MGVDDVAGSGRSKQQSYTERLHIIEGNISTFVNRRKDESRAWRDGLRQACATHPAGTVRVAFVARASAMSVVIVRSARSKAVSAPVSRTMLVTQRWWTAGVVLRSAPRR